MGLRIELHEKFEELLGSKNVYYQPPETLKLVYPCIIYKKVPGTPWWANNNLYVYHDEYEAILITLEPDSEYVQKMIEFPMTRYSRHYTADNLYHDVFNVYF